MAFTTLGNLQLVDHTGDWPDEYVGVPLQAKRLIIIHHSGSPKNTTPRAIYDYTKQYGGFAYNCLVYDDGAYFYGGGWNSERAGAAQTPYLNRMSYHICLVGDFTDDSPSAKQLEAAATLLANLQYARGLRLPIVPHCIFNVEPGTPRSKWNTVCPGLTWPYWFGRLLGGGS